MKKLLKTGLPILAAVAIGFSVMLFCTADAAIKHGDANSDGKVTAADVLLIRKYLAKWEVADLISEANADANADGKITAADVLLVRKHLAKWDVVLGTTAEEIASTEPTEEPETIEIETREPTSTVEPTTANLIQLTTEKDGAVWSGIY